MPLLLTAIWRLRRASPRNPVLLAGAALLLVELVGVVGGGSYWDHYLLATIPGVALLVALATRPPGQRLLTGVLAGSLVSALVAGGVTLIAETERSLGREATMAAWLREARQPGDTGLVIHGQPQVLERAGLRPAYPFLWSLPTRVMDPELARMTATLDSPGGPDWVVQLGSIDTWSLDPTGRAQQALDAHYRPVANVCGFPVLLRQGVQRTLPPLPDC